MSKSWQEFLEKHNISADRQAASEQRAHKFIASLKLGYVLLILVSAIIGYLKIDLLKKYWLSFDNSFFIPLVSNISEGIWILIPLNPLYIRHNGMLSFLCTVQEEQ